MADAEQAASQEVRDRDERDERDERLLRAIDAADRASTSMTPYLPINDKWMRGFLDALAAEGLEIVVAADRPGLGETLGCSCPGGDSCGGFGPCETSAGGGST